MIFTYVTNTSTAQSKNTLSNPLEVFENLYEDYLSKKFEKSSITDSTKRQNKIMKNRFIRFLKENGKSEIKTSEIDTTIINAFFAELKFNSRSTSSYHRNIYYHLDNVFTYALKKGLCKQNPILQTDIHKADTKKLVFLSEQQLNYLYFLKINPHIRTVLDVFIFQCYTGLSYIDLLNFRYDEHYRKEKDQLDKIIIQRQKTKETCIIPVLPRAKAILNKYNNKLPVKNYDYYMTMLDVITSIINLDFKLTTHIGRKTAGVYLLNAGVSLEVVSKVLGHKYITTTEKYYTVVLTKRMDKEFQELY